LKWAETLGKKIFKEAICLQAGIKIKYMELTPNNSRWDFGKQRD